jgi:hypothetical protein
MLIVLALLLALLEQSNAPPTRILNPTNPNPMPGDARMNQFEDVKGSNWRVFAIDANPHGAVAITGVDEVRQQNPPSTWAVYAGNRELLPVNSVTLAAAIVDVNGKVKATQVLPAIKNLKPQQISRKEIPIRVTIVAPTDRIVFYVKEIKSETADWKAVDADVESLIRLAAARMPVP